MALFYGPPFHLYHLFPKTVYCHDKSLLSSQNFNCYFDGSVVISDLQAFLDRVNDGGPFRKAATIVVRALGHCETRKLIRIIVPS